MITHIPRRHIGAGIRGEVESFNNIGPDQTVVVPLTKRCSYLLEEATHHCDYVQIGDKRYMINRMVRVEQHGHKTKKFKLERVNSVL